MGKIANDYSAVTNLTGTERIPVVTNPGVAGGDHWITATNLGASDVMDAAILAALTVSGTGLFDAAGAAASVAATSAANLSAVNVALDTRIDLLEAAGSISSTMTTVTVANTVTETNLLTGIAALPAASTAATDRILLTATLDAKNNSGIAATLTYRLKLGATTLLTTTALSYNDSANRCPSLLEVVMTVIDADSLLVTMELKSGNAAAAGTAGLRNTNHEAVGLVRSDGVFAMASTNTFSLTAQWSAANALTDVALYEAELAVIKGP